MEPELNQPENTPKRSREGLFRGLFIVSACLAIAFFVLLIQTRAQWDKAYMGSVYKTNRSILGNCVTTLWKNGAPAFKACDKDFEGVDDEIIAYNFQGEPLTLSIDKNNNGNPELVVGFDKSGNKAHYSFDLNEDGFAEYIEIIDPNGKPERFFDSNDDQYFSDKERIKKFPFDPNNPLGL